MSKHSDDYIKLMHLIHDEEFVLTEVSLKMDQVQDMPGYFIERSKFVLVKENENKLLESTEEDLALLVWHFKSFPNLDYKNEFRKVKNLERYFEDSKFLVDSDGTKLKQASEAIAKGEIKLDYPIEGLIDKFLNEDNNRNRANKKYIKLRTDYYYILFYHLSLLNQQKTLLDKHNTNNNFKKYNDFLFKRIMEYVKDDKPVEMYKKLLKVMEFDPADKMSIYTGIKRDNNDVLSMIQRYYGQSTNTTNVIPRLLDMYRKFAEFSADYIRFFTRIEYELENKEYDDSVGYTENFHYLNTKIEYSPILKSLDPNIRHSESHLNTKIDDKLGKIVITEQKNRKRKITREYTYAEFTEMLKELDRALALAFTISVMSAYLIILHQVIVSFEYKVLLLGVDNRV